MSILLTQSLLSSPPSLPPLSPLPPSCPPSLPQTKKQELKECIVADLQEKQRVAEQEKTSLDLAVGGCGSVAEVEMGVAGEGGLA